VIFWGNLEGAGLGTSHRVG